MCRCADVPPRSHCSLGSLTNATLSQDLDGELLTLSVTNLCVPADRPPSRRHDAASSGIGLRDVTMTWRYRDVMVRRHCDTPYTTAHYHGVTTRSRQYARTRRHRDVMTRR